MRKPIAFIGNHSCQCFAFRTGTIFHNFLVGKGNLINIRRQYSRLNCNVRIDCNRSTGWHSKYRSTGWHSGYRSTDWHNRYRSIIGGTIAQTNRHTQHNCQQQKKWSAIHRWSGPGTMVWSVPLEHCDYQGGPGPRKAPPAPRPLRHK
jgi:hypothetical protein